MTESINRILVPVDFSMHSHRAMRYATTLAAKFGARVSLLHVVEKSARRRDHDLGPRANRADLRLEADAAEDRGGGQRSMAAVDAEALLDLEGELAGGRQHQRTDGATAGGRRAVRSWCPVQALEDRQHEGRSLAGARLGCGEEIPAGQDDGDRLVLHGGGLGVALVRDGANELGREPEGLEGH